MRRAGYRNPEHFEREQAMTDDNPNPAQSPEIAGFAPIRVETQYVKDLSFENPRAPNSLRVREQPPAVDVKMDVSARKLDDGVFEVVLNSTVTGSADNEKLFLVELSYAGVFTVTAIPDEHLQPVLFYECPRLLFPFVRNIVADVTRDGGFPPLLIQPIDFARLHRSMQQAPNQTRQ